MIIKSHIVKVTNLVLVATDCSLQFDVVAPILCIGGCRIVPLELLQESRHRLGLAEGKKVTKEIDTYPVGWDVIG